jgi:hypothetical protein
MRIVLSCFPDAVVALRLVCEPVGFWREHRILEPLLTSEERVRKLQGTRDGLTRILVVWLSLGCGAPSAELIAAIVQSAEDIELRDKLALLVERVKDSDPKIVKTSLETMRCLPPPPYHKFDRACCWCAVGNSSWVRASVRVVPAGRAGSHCGRCVGGLSCCLMLSALQG